MEKRILPALILWLLLAPACMPAPAETAPARAPEASPPNAAPCARPCAESEPGPFHRGMAPAEIAVTGDRLKAEGMAEEQILRWARNVWDGCAPLSCSRSSSASGKSSSSGGAEKTE